MNRLIICGILWLALLLAAPFAGRALGRVLGLVRPNFRGDRIPASVGITFLIIAAVTYTMVGALIPSLGTAARGFGLVSVGFGLLGLADDLWGSRAVGGYRGHLRALLRGHLTTGAIKLLGGGIVALLAAWLVRGPNLPLLLLDALLIALAANTLNLLDLRPGRALFGFALLALPTLICLLRSPTLSGSALLGVVALSAATEWLPDTRGRAMMGDTGSNLLGASAGLAAALTLPLTGRIVLLLALAALNLAAERVSLATVIARTPWLAALDRQLGVR